VGEGLSSVNDHRVLLFPTCSRPLFSEAFTARDPPRSPPLRSGAGVSYAAKDKKTIGLTQIVSKRSTL
jgi:hypothetical protein